MIIPVSICHRECFAGFNQAVLYLHIIFKPVGSKEANELGLYDMSGNVREWCWDWHEPDGTDAPGGRIWKGGGWIGADFCCEPSFKAHHEANGKGPDQGFRVCRGSK